MNNSKMRQFEIGGYNDFKGALKEQFKKGIAEAEYVNAYGSSISLKLDPMKHTASIIAHDENSHAMEADFKKYAARPECGDIVLGAGYQFTMTAQADMNKERKDDMPEQMVTTHRKFGI